MIVEAGAAEIAFAEPISLNHHAPRAVQQQDALPRLLLQPCNAGGPVETHALVLAAAQGEMPRRRHVA